MAAAGIRPCAISRKQRVSLGNVSKTVYSYHARNRGKKYSKVDGKRKRVKRASSKVIKITGASITQAPSQG